VNQLASVADSPLVDPKPCIHPSEKRGVLIPVRPPRAVWVDLGAMFRIDRPRRVVPDGMDLQATVPGSLFLWSITSTGHWVGYVSFTIRKADAGAAVAQWVLADALRPQTDLPGRAGRR
jgi:hypothetical protein